MGWLIAVGVLTGLCLLPVGIRAVYDSSGTAVCMIVGPVSFLLYPKDKKKKQKVSSDKVRDIRQKPANKSPGPLSDFRPLADLAVSLLGELRRRICVKNLEMRLTLAGDDPADLAVHYGQAWALLGSLFPRLDDLLHIKKRNLSVNCDFTADEPMFYGRIHITITLGRLLMIALCYGHRSLQEYRKIVNQRKGGAKL